MKIIRVLHVLASLDRGGAETMIMNIYRNIDRNKIQFDFVVNDSKRIYHFEDEVMELGGRVFRIPQYNVLNYFVYRKIWLELLNNHPEWLIIHGHHTSPAVIYFSVAKLLNRVSIAHSHTAGAEKTLKSYLKKIMRNLIKNKFDYLFACSKEAAKWMFSKYAYHASIINNAIDVKQFAYSEETRTKIRNELNIVEKLVIGHVGSFSEPKNHAFLVEIFAQLVKIYPESILVLVGDGKLRSKIKSKVESLGIADKVVFTGVCSDVSDILQAMDVFVFPSFFEGLGIVVIEAQASGLPCVISDVVPEEARITDLVEALPLSLSPQKWADKILQFANANNRRDTSNEIRYAGYDVEKTSKWLQDFYLRKTFNCK